MLLGKLHYAGGSYQPFRVVITNLNYTNAIKIRAEGTNLLMSEYKILRFYKSMRDKTTEEKKHAK